MPDTDSELLDFINKIDDQDKIYLLILLLIQKAFLAQRMFDADSFDYYIQKAYNIAIILIKLNGISNNKNDNIKIQLQMIDVIVLNQQQKITMFNFYKLLGRWNLAEDILYYLKEDNYSNINEAIKIFYKEILEEPDESLIKGNLPREEITSDLNKLEKDA